VRDGIRLVLKQFADTLERHGVTSFSAVGAKFDPMRHEALMQQETTDVPADHVVSELARGYLLNDRLVRPATVVVARAP
jgi:molecular chaperone GrpE